MEEVTAKKEACLVLAGTSSLISMNMVTRPNRSLFQIIANAII
jgi:hypothetical protein